MTGYTDDPTDFATIDCIQRATGCSLTTAKRWKANPATMPDMAQRLTRYHVRGELRDLFGKEWEGFTMHKGRLFAPSWRNGFAPGEIKAMFFRVQQVRALESNVRQLERDLQRERERCEALERSNYFYRSQVMREARFGMVLERVFG